MKKILLFVNLLLGLFLCTTGSLKAASTWKTTSVDSQNLGYGVTLDKVLGTSTSSFNSTTTSERPQEIYTVNVPTSSKARVVVWGINRANNTWGSYKLESIAADYEAKHPNQKVLAATNNWLSDTLTNNIGELDAVQVLDGLNYRVTDAQGTKEDVIGSFKHGYIPRPNFLGFDASGKKAYFSDDWNSGSNYTTELTFSYYNGVNTERTKLGIVANKLNEEPAEGEVSIFFPNYKSGPTSFDGATIYKMKPLSIRYDYKENVTSFIERDAFAMGTLIEKVDAMDLSRSTVGREYYIVSKNEEFNNLDLTNKTLVASYELLGEYANVVGATTYYYHIVKNGEIYPEGHSHEINDEVHPRTAFIIKEDGSFALSVIDGRQKGKTGMEYMEMSYFYKTMYDAKDVFNYDGGGSSCMIVANEKGSFDIVNSPSDGNERSVGNATLVVVDKDPYVVSQTSILENGFTLSFTDVSENVKNIYALVNGNKITVENNELVVSNLNELTTYPVQLSYELDSGEIIDGALINAKTCDLFTRIHEVTFDDITQDSANVIISLDDSRSTFYQGIVEINGEQKYFLEDGAIVTFNNLTPSTKYNVLVHIYSKTGTVNQHEDIYTYELETTKAKYPVSLTCNFDKTNFYVGDSGKVNVTYDPDGTRTVLTYSSSNEQVVTVDTRGNVSAIGLGEATITVTSKEGVTSSILIKVIEKAQEPTPTPEPETPVKKGCKKTMNEFIYLLSMSSLLVFILKKKK